MGAGKLLFSIIALQEENPPAKKKKVRVTGEVYCYFNRATAINNQ